MSNHRLRNHALSLKAKELLSQMLLLPEDWGYTLRGFAQINRENVDAIREAVRELERAGYIERSCERGSLRGTVYTIYEQPQTEPTPENVHRLCLHWITQHWKSLSIFVFVLIGLTQLGTRCSDGSCQAHEDLIAGFSAIEAEAELVQIRLKLCAAAVIGSQQERFQVADGFVQPMQTAGLIFFHVQHNAGQIPIASVAVAFDFCTRCNGFVYDLLKRAAGDVFNDLHPREQHSPVFRF